MAVFVCFFVFFECLKSLSKCEFFLKLSLDDCSVDQFFECFDGMRSFRSVLGSSGMWGWTGSVFNAITAASNLASGSLDISTGIQTFFKSTS